jgi:hypothetical protein
MFKKKKYSNQEKLLVDDILIFDDFFINKFLNDSMMGSKNCLVNYSGINISRPEEVKQTLCPDCVGCGCPLAQTESTNYPDPEISYKFNKNVYRCDELNKDYSSENFLFSGCSYTIGTGIPYEGTWAYQLNKELNGEKFYNIAVNGASYKTIIYDVYNYINTYGKPKAIFILFPNLERFPSFVNVENTIMQNTLHDQLIGNENATKILTKHFLHFDFYHLVRSLEDYLEVLDIPFLWGTWHPDLEQNLVKIFSNFKNYIKIVSNENNKEYFSNNGFPTEVSQKYWKNARDLLHSGMKVQMLHKKIFLNEWKKRYENIN